MLSERGQSTLEYALIIAVVIAGLLVMQHYVKRGFAGRVKGSADDLGEQYDPVAYSGSFTVSQSSRTQRETAGGVSTTTHLDDQENTREGEESLDAWGEDEDIYSR